MQGQEIFADSNYHLNFNLRNAFLFLAASKISRFSASEASPQRSISFSVRPQPIQMSCSSRQQFLTQGDEMVITDHLFNAH